MEGEVYPYGSILLVRIFVLQWRNDKILQNRLLYFVTLNECINLGIDNQQMLPLKKKKAQMFPFGRMLPLENSYK